MGGIWCGCIISIFAELYADMQTLGLRIKQHKGRFMFLRTLKNILEDSDSILNMLGMQYQGQNQIQYILIF